MVLSRKNRDDSYRFIPSVLRLWRPEMPWPSELASCGQPCCLEPGTQPGWGRHTAVPTFMKWLLTLLTLQTIIEPQNHGA